MSRILRELEARGLLAECTHIARAHGVSLELVCSADRSGFLGPARGAIFLHLRTAYGYSYPAIGRLFGRDHATIMHHCRKAELRKGNPDEPIDLAFACAGGMRK